MKKIPHSNQYIAMNQPSSTSVKHLHIEQFMDQAAATAQAAKRSRSMMLDHYQVG
ncbi:hypothetical protein DITRI_Ditri13aG0072900 [Diplodiscus trichospermus]